MKSGSISKKALMVGSYVVSICIVLSPRPTIRSFDDASMRIEKRLKREYRLNLRPFLQITKASMKTEAVLQQTCHFLLPDRLSQTGDATLSTVEGKLRTRPPNDDPRPCIHPT